jgi:hypothetical protein
MPAALIQARTASTGQAVEPRAIAIVAPRPSLALVNGHPQSVIAKLEIGYVEGLEFGTSDCAGEAEQKEGPVAKAFHVGVGLCDHRKDPIGASHGGSLEIIIFEPPNWTKGQSLPR